MNIIVNVTNDEYVCANIMAPLQEKEALYTVSSSRAPYRETPVDEAVALWCPTENDEKYIRYIDERSLHEDGYNEIRIPFSGLQYLIARDRKLNITDRKYCILAIKERYPTQVVTQNLFNIYVTGWQMPSFSIIKNEFAKYDSNILLTSHFDRAIENITVKNDIAPQILALTNL